MERMSCESMICVPERPPFASLIMAAATSSVGIGFQERIRPIKFIPFRMATPAFSPKRSLPFRMRDGGRIRSFPTAPVAPMTRAFILLAVNLQDGFTSIQFRFILHSGIEYIKLGELMQVSDIVKHIRIPFSIEIPINNIGHNPFLVYHLG